MRYIRQTVNIGAPRNWNFVADQARGQSFLGASANDFYDARMLDKCVAALAADPLAVLCYRRTYIVDEDPDERRPFLHDFSAMDARPSERFKTVRHCLVLNNTVIGVVRLDVLRTNQGDQLYRRGDLVLIAGLALLRPASSCFPTCFCTAFSAPSASSIRADPGRAADDLSRDYHTEHSSSTAGRTPPRGYLDTVLHAPVQTTQKLRLLPLITRHTEQQLAVEYDHARRRTTWLRIRRAEPAPFH